jgi:hypothetical protein
MAITDIFVIVVGLFIIGFSILLGNMLMNNIFPDLKAMMPQATATLNTVQASFQVMDWIFLFVTAGLAIITILLATQIGTHPAFFFISLLLTMICLIITPVFSNMFRDIAISTEFNSVAESYPIMRFIMQNLPVVILGISIGTSIVLYAKIRGGGNE